MKYISILITFLNFLSFLLSVFNVFKKIDDIHQVKQMILKILSIITWITILYQMSIQTENILTSSMNIFIQSILLVLFWKTSTIVKKNQFSIAYSNDLPTQLIKEGLYKKIRHPFYMIYILSYFTSALVTLSPICIFMSILMFILYFDAAKSEEKKFSSTNLNSDYENYKKNAGLFWPKFIRN